MAQHRNSFEARTLVASVCLLVASLGASAAAPVDGAIQADKELISLGAARLALDTVKTPKPVIQVTTPKPAIQVTTPKPPIQPKVTGTATVVPQKPQTVVQQKPQTNLTTKKNFWCEDDCAPSRPQTKFQNGQSIRQ